MRRTKQDALETRAAILDAAEAVFHRLGVARAALADIASAAKVTRGAIYWHFADKADLFKAMIERVSAPEEEFFRQAAGSDAGASLSGLKALSLEMVRRFAANDHAQRVHEVLLFRCEYVGEMSEALQRRREGEQAFEKAILDAFGRARAGEDGLGGGWSPDVASAALRGAVMGLIADWLRLDRGYDIVDVGTAILDGLFAGFAGDRVLSTGQVRPKDAQGS